MVGCFEHGYQFAGVNKIWEFTGLAEELLASEEVFWPMVLVLSLGYTDHN
jgi:hypothetical protein